jgi:hypothetical protein
VITSESSRLLLTFCAVPVRVRAMSHYYYFQVGGTVGDERSAFIATDGTLVRPETGLAHVRKFATLRAANKFFLMMNGRYAGQRLYLRTGYREWARPAGGRSIAHVERAARNER